MVARNTPPRPPPLYCWCWRSFADSEWASERGRYARAATQRTKQHGLALVCLTIFNFLMLLPAHSLLPCCLLMTTGAPRSLPHTPAAAIRESSRTHETAQHTHTHVHILPRGDTASTLPRWRVGFDRIEGNKKNHSLHTPTQHLLPFLPAFPSIPGIVRFLEEWEFAARAGRRTSMRRSGAASLPAAAAAAASRVCLYWAICFKYTLPDLNLDNTS